MSGLSPARLGELAARDIQRLRDTIKAAVPEAVVFDGKIAFPERHTWKLVRDASSEAMPLYDYMVFKDVYRRVSDQLVADLSEELPGLVSPGLGLTFCYNHFDIPAVGWFSFQVFTRISLLA
jgi:hypothetical protein